MLNYFSWTFYRIGCYWLAVMRGDSQAAGYLAWQMRGMTGPKWVQHGEPGCSELCDHIVAKGVDRG